MRINWTREEIILACDLVWENGWTALDASKREVRELSDLLISSPLHPREGRPEQFRNPNGVGRKTSDIATRHPDYKGKPTRGNRLDERVLQDFLDDPDRMHGVANQIRSLLTEGLVSWQDLQSSNDAVEEDEQSEASEGNLLRAWHLKRERSPKLRRKKLEVAKAAGRPIACEVCLFDFCVTYGERGYDFIEVHHIVPLHASGQTNTRIQDLIMLCSNCHRMIHRGKTWLTPEELKALVSLPGATSCS